MIQRVLDMEQFSDRVVLDLMYEARDIDQKLSSPDRVDAWFEAKTKSLNDYQKKEIMNKWGTMQKVLSSKSRMEKIITDIELDFTRIPVLARSTGNAMLVAGSIYEAFNYYKLLQDKTFRGKCSVITSYNPQIGDIRTEELGEGTDTDKQFIYETCKKMLEGNSDNGIELKDRVKELRKNFEGALEKIESLCEGIQPPKTNLYFRRYFCGNPELESDLKDREYLRVKLYEMTAKLVRCFSNLSPDLDQAKYNKREQIELQRKVTYYIEIRNEIKRASGEIVDLKSYEADMRHLIDNYIQAEDSRKISPFDEIPLLTLIENLGIHKAIQEHFPEGETEDESSREAVAETIENNIRKKIIKEELLDSEFYAHMSDLLKEVIADRKAKAIDYENYLKRIFE